MLRVIVTGANGFVGRHLIRELRMRGHEIIGVGHGGNVEPEIQEMLLSYHQCDLSDPRSVAELPLEHIDSVINLAGLAKQGASFADANRYTSTNVAMLQVMGERLLRSRSKARIIAVSTGAVYDAAQPLPLTETARTTITGSPYAHSKLMMEQAARELQQKGLQCIIVRPFNHAGPGQAPGFLVPDLFAELTKAKQSNQPARVGNLTSRRDYTDVRDIVKAYADLAASETLEFDLYNVCSGTSRSGEEILEIFLKHMELTGNVHIEINPSLIRPKDPANLYGSFERIREETGWEPVIPIEQTIADFIASAS